MDRIYAYEPVSGSRVSAPLVVVLPHAGASAYQFGALAAQLGPGWRVRCLELPGRGRRVSEPFIADFDAAVADINDRLADLSDQPWLLFGHSLGAHLGVALLRVRWRAGQSLPRVFFPSGAVAPSAYEVSPMASLSSDAFWARVGLFGGVPEALLADKTHRAYFETILRHDMALLEQARFYALPPMQRQPLEPLAVPMVMLMGDADAAALRCQEWQAETALPLTVETFSGGHFYLFDAWPAVADVLIRHGGPQGAADDG